MIRVLVVDDHPVVRQGLTAILRWEPDLEIVGEAADGPEAVRRILDLQNRSIVYVSHSRELVQGSAKLDISTIALTPQEVATAQRR